MNKDFIYFQVRAAIVGNYKHDRLFGRGEEYGNTVIQNAYERLLEMKRLDIGHYEAKAGRNIKFVLDGDVLVEIE